MNSVKRNLISNIIAKFWGFFSSYLLTPLFLFYLGAEAFGLVSFFTTLMGIMVLLDLGFTATLSRELARLSSSENTTQQMRNFTRTYEVLYTFLSFLLVFFIWFLAPLITEYWLKTNRINHQEIITAIRIMGFALAFQFSSALYHGGLMGLQFQVKANIIQTSWSIFRGVGTLIVLWKITPSIISFALWQLISNFLYYLIVNYSLWNALSGNQEVSKPQFNWIYFRDTKKYIFGMSLIAFLSTILIQADKIVVSKLLTLEFFGYYSLATTLASFPLLLANPIASTTFPLFTKIYEKGDKANLNLEYHKYSKIISVLVFPSTFLLIFFAKDFLFLWTGSIKISEQIWITTTLLLLGQLIQAIMILPYHIALSQGQTSLNVKLQLYSIFLIIPLLIYLISLFGINGGGSSWLIVNLLFFPVYMYYFNSRFLIGEFKEWIINDIGLPILVTIIFIFFIKIILPTSLSRVYLFINLFATWLLTTFVLIFVIPEFRFQLFKYIKKFKFNA